MELLHILLLMVSISCGALRSVLTKGYSSLAFGKRSFYIAQCSLFFSGALVMLFDAGTSILRPSSLTLLFAFIYGVLIVTAQWCYTVAMKLGKTGICAAVYSLAFIFPTLSGIIFFSESISVINFFGVALVIPTIIISAKKPKKMVENKDNGTYFIPLLAAMLASGGMGILQKIQQNSSVRTERGAFLFFAFMIATAISLTCSLISKKEDENGTAADINTTHGIGSSPAISKNVNTSGIGAQENVADKKSAIAKAVQKLGIYKVILAIPAAAGLCFAICNIINTMLAGVLPSAVFFPLVNIGSIFASLALGSVIYKEKITKMDT